MTMRTQLPDDPLDRMLTAALVAPATPEALQARVIAAVARDEHVDLSHARRQLLERHLAAVARLRRHLIRGGLETLLLAGCLLLPVRPGVERLLAQTEDFAGSLPAAFGWALSLALAGGAAFAVLAAAPQRTGREA